MGSDQGRAGEQEQRMSSTVDSLYEMIEESWGDDDSPEAKRKRESSISTLARHFARLAEGTLGNEIVIPDLPIWSDQIMPVLRRLQTPEQAVVATRLAADLFEDLYNIRFATLVDGESA